MRVKKRLGELLVENNLMTNDQLQKAIVGQKGSGLKIGQYLVQKGLVSESQIVEVVSRQLRIEKYHPNRFPVDMQMTKLIPAELAQKHQAVPLMKKGFVLLVAMADPMDIAALDAIEVHTNTEVEPVMCTEQEINQLINSLYGSYTNLGNMLEDMGGTESGGEREDRAAAGIGEVEVSSLKDMAEDAPVIRLVNSILSQAVKEGASDVHIGAEKDYVEVRFRVDGKLHSVPAPPKSMFMPIVSRVKILANMDIASSRIPQDGRFTMRLGNKEINVRASTLPTIYGENLVLRLLDTSGSVLTLEQIGMSAEDRTKVAAMIHKPYGMILSGGPTGSGKSTSLFAILKQINQPDVNIITLEDPVEYRMEHVRQAQLNRKAGMTFVSGLKSILRQDPDVIMVGEIRDSETATIAVQAALTGHLVLSTLHTNDAAGTVTRFIDMGIEPFLIASVMLVSIGQRLVRTICNHCTEPYTPDPKALAYWNITDEQIRSANFQRGKGCFNCMDTGYKGRTGLYEVLAIDDEIQDLIVKKESSQTITRYAIQSGRLNTLKDDAIYKILAGKTTLEEAASAVMT